MSNEKWQSGVFECACDDQCTNIRLSRVDHSLRKKTSVEYPTDGFMRTRLTQMRTVLYAGVFTRIVAIAMNVKLVCG